MPNPVETKDYNLNNKKERRKKESEDPLLNSFLVSFFF